MMEGIRRTLGTRRRPGDWHRSHVGGMWDLMGPKQFDFMVCEGLAPHHRMLDVGCGSLRGGIHFIRYLDRGNYIGADLEQELLDAGRDELDHAGVTGKEPTLIATGTFDFQGTRDVDYALAQSVWSHLPWNLIVRCLSNVRDALAIGGRFYATFFPQAPPRLSAAPLSRAGPAEDPRYASFETFLDADPFHYDPDIFRWLCEGSDMAVENLGDWGHPRGQYMLRFTKTDHPG